MKGWGPCQAPRRSDVDSASLPAQPLVVVAGEQRRVDAPQVRAEAAELAGRCGRDAPADGAGLLVDEDGELERGQAAQGAGDDRVAAGAHPQAQVLGELGDVEVEAVGAVVEQLPEAAPGERGRGSGRREPDELAVGVVGGNPSRSMMGSGQATMRSWAGRGVRAVASVTSFMVSLLVASPRERFSGLVAHPAAPGPGSRPGSGRPQRS